jgi:tetratricopeptide (TPR) repeat protein
MTSEDSWAQIEEAFEKDQWATLLELCALHLKENPEHPYARIWQAVALSHLSQQDRAINLLERIYKDPNTSSYCKYQCQRELGQTFEEMGRFNDARRAYEEAHQLDPKNIVPLIYRGAMEVRVGEFAAAREWLNRALECPKGRFDEAHFNIAGTYLCEGNYSKAIEHYQKAITIDPNYDIAWERLADAKRALEIREQSE